MAPIMPIPMRPLTDILFALNRSPLAQLSLCSRELFHSNFLAWLCDNYREVGAAVFGSLHKTPQSGRISEVRREVKNIDLWLSFDSGGELIVENKVNSIPYASQLDSYSSKMSNGNTSFLLLSLCRPGFLNSQDRYEDTQKEMWRFLGYSDLADRLERAMDEPGAPEDQSYDYQIVQDYVGYIRSLAELHDYFSLGGDPGACFFSDVENQLKGSRFLQGVVKMRYAQLAVMLEMRLNKMGFKIFREPSEYWKGKAGSVLCCSAMTRGTGMVDFKYCLIGSGCGSPLLTLGVQLQGRQFRLVVERPTMCALETARKFRENTAARGKWFDFDRLAAVSDGHEFPKKEDFNKFGKVFRYRSKLLRTGVTADEIVEIISGYSSWIRDQSNHLVALGR